MASKIKYLILGIDSLYIDTMLMKKYMLALSFLCLNSCQINLVPQQGVGLKAFQTQNDWYQDLSPELQAYYAPAQGKTGLDLFEALATQSNQAQVLDYGDAMAFLYQVAERVPQGKSSLLRAAYSNILITGDGPSGHKYQEEGDANRDGKKGDAINCEHTWPQSFFNKQGAMRSDLHHLFPTLSTPNSKRGNNPFGEASQGHITYATQSGSKLASLNNGTAVFEPDNTQKGNTARAILYFYLRYHQQNIRSADYRADFFIPRLDLFKAWSLQDPVDAHELRRHQLIAQRQGNRNPFIDIPNLIDLIGIDTLTQLEAHS